MIKLEMLKCFVAVARSGNLSDAGDRLGRTPSAVSMMLKQFEEHLGEALFESDRKSRLTTLGEFVLEEAVRGVDHFERIVMAIENFAQSKAGYVRIAAVPSVAEAILPHAVRSFLQAHPEVRIDIQDMDSASVIRELERERVDLGIATDISHSADLHHGELFSDAFGVVCLADHPLTEIPRPIDWAAIEAWPFIANGLCGHIAHETFQRVFARSNLMVHNTTSLLALVRAGVGYTVLPRLVANRAGRELTFLPVSDPAARRKIDIIRQAHAAPSPATRNFERAIRDAVQNLAAQ